MLAVAHNIHEGPAAGVSASWWRRVAAGWRTCRTATRRTTSSGRHEGPGDAADRRGEPQAAPGEVGHYRAQ